MLFIAKPRYDADGNDLAPVGARMNDKVYLQHIELSEDTEGAIIGTDADELLAHPLVTEKVEMVTLAEELLAAAQEDAGVTA